MNMHNYILLYQHVVFQQKISKILKNGWGGGCMQFIGLYINNISLFEIEISTESI